MTHEEQQALFDTILRRANRPGSFNVENGIRLTSLSDGGAEGEVRLTAGHLNPLGIVHGGVYCTLLDQVAGAAACTRGSRGLTVNCETRQSGYPLRRRHLHLPHEARLPGGLTSRHPFPAPRSAPPRGVFLFRLQSPPK